ncbi:hypothetical protein LTS18_012201, partial [Coniosporium uncinatum]
MAVPESDILKPTALSVADEDHWPEFILTNVEVRNTVGQIANLFDADEDHTLVVTGRLESPGRDNQRFFLKKDYRKT